MKLFIIQNLNEPGQPLIAEVPADFFFNFMYHKYFTATAFGGTYDPNVIVRAPNDEVVYVGHYSAYPFDAIRNQWGDRVHEWAEQGSEPEGPVEAII